MGLFTEDMTSDSVVSWLTKYNVNLVVMRKQDTFVSGSANFSSSFQCSCFYRYVVSYIYTLYRRIRFIFLL